MNVFIDATSSCRSARNSGMQRMTRRIFAELAARIPVTPICWNRLGNFYHRLGPGEMEYLKTPFHRYHRPMSRPHAREDWLREFQRLLGRVSLDLLNLLQDDDVFFAPDTFRPANEKLPESARRTRARSVAIFHDAAELQLSLLSRRRMEKFRNYIKSLAAFDLVICISTESRADLLEVWKRSGATVRAETFVAGWPLEFDESERSARIVRDQLSSMYRPLMRARTTCASFTRPNNYGTAASNSNFNSLVRARIGGEE